MDSQQIIRKQLEEAQETLSAFISHKDTVSLLDQAGKMLSGAFSNGKKVISCGNGGSMCDAMHFAEELTGRFRTDRKPLPAIAISDPSYLTCTANDYGFEKVFSRFIESIANKGDVLLAISTSGNSTNVVEAMKTAREKGMNIIALTGKDGGKMKTLCDIEIRAPHSTYSDRAQEIHIKVIHILIQLTEMHLGLTNNN